MNWSHFRSGAYDRIAYYANAGVTVVLGILMEQGIIALHLPYPNNVALIAVALLLLPMYLTDYVARHKRIHSVNGKLSDASLLVVLWIIGLLIMLIPEVLRQNPYLYQDDPGTSILGQRISLAGIANVPSYYYVDIALSVTGWFYVARHKQNYLGKLHAILDRQRAVIQQDEQIQQGLRNEIWDLRRDLRRDVPPPPASEQPISNNPDLVKPGAATTALARDDYDERFERVSTRLQQEYGYIESWAGLLAILYLADGWLKRNQLKATARRLKVPLKEASEGQTLARLKDNSLIEEDPARKGQGYYRIILPFRPAPPVKASGRPRRRVTTAATTPKVADPDQSASNETQGHHAPMAATPDQSASTGGQGGRRAPRGAARKQAGKR